MSRDDGFPRADLDSAYQADRKVKAILRRGGDPWRTTAILGLHVFVIIESWRVGERVTLDDAAPMAWTTDDLDEARAVLIEAGLLDDESKVPARS